MKFLVLFLMLFLTFGSSASVQAKESGDLVVLELFTSQSCSSCPPADKILSTYAAQDNVIALSCNVTYWNHLHWKDTLSKQFCTDRQRSYAPYVSNGRVFTPQLIVNGSHSVVGNNRADVERVVATAGKDKVETLIISRKGQNKLSVSLPQLGAGFYIIEALSYMPRHTENIRAGENRGKKVIYTNPVTDLRYIGRWNGEKKVLDVPSLTGQHAVILIRDQQNGKIVAAGKIRL